MNSAPRSLDLKAVKTPEKPENAASKGTHEEAEMKKAGSSNITFGDTTMAVLEFLEYTNYQKGLEKKKGPWLEDITDIRENNTTSVDIISQMKPDLINAVFLLDPYQHESTHY